jgi:large subunit ribosomal protein L15
VGRGPGSGRGKTAGRGQKGQNARSGGKPHPRFEGGQMPLIRRIPKRGFKSRARVEYQVVNVRDLERMEGDVTPRSLKEAGLIGTLRKPVKVLGQGELAKKLSVSAHRFSRSAQSKIEKAGGSVTVIDRASSEADSTEA